MSLLLSGYPRIETQYGMHVIRVWEQRPTMEAGTVLLYQPEVKEQTENPFLSNSSIILASRLGNGFR